jgi:hypothetical protein
MVDCALNDVVEDRRLNPKTRSLDEAQIRGSFDETDRGTDIEGNSSDGTFVSRSSQNQFQSMVSRLMAHQLIDTNFYCKYLEKLSGYHLSA